MPLEFDLPLSRRNEPSYVKKFDIKGEARNNAPLLPDWMQSSHSEPRIKSSSIARTYHAFSQKRKRRQHLINTAWPLRGVAAGNQIGQSSCPSTYMPVWF